MNTPFDSLRYDEQAVVTNLLRDMAVAARRQLGWQIKEDDELDKARQALALLIIHNRSA
jgi:hypothetical protein